MCVGKIDIWLSFSFEVAISNVFEWRKRAAKQIYALKKKRLIDVQKLVSLCSWFVSECTCVCVCEQPPISKSKWNALDFGCGEKCTAIIVICALVCKIIRKREIRQQNKSNQKKNRAEKKEVHFFLLWSEGGISK